MPINNPLTPKIAGEINRMRSKEEAKFCWSGGKSGARMYLIICGASKADTILTILKTIRIRLLIDDASFQAGVRSFLVRRISAVTDRSNCLMQKPA